MGFMQLERSFLKLKNMVILESFFLMLTFFFFFYSNKDIYSRTLPYAKKHKAERNIQREKKEYKDKERKKY